MEILVLILFFTSITSPLVLCQDVDARGASSNDKVISSEGSGQGRTIYSPRHISPHRMMHFGKRPAVEEPPTILTPQGYDLYEPGKHPYLFHLEFQRGQSLQQPVPEAGNLLYSYDYPVYRFFNNGNPQQQRFLQQQPQFGITNGQRLSRLMALDNNNNNDEADDLNNGNSDTDNEQSSERAQPSSNGSEDNQQQQNSNINLNTRSSMQSGRNGNSKNSLPKQFISSLLYGRSSSASIPSFVTFNKKAEPKDNFFMHFGRK